MEEFETGEDFFSNLNDFIGVIEVSVDFLDNFGGDLDAGFGGHFPVLVVLEGFGEFGD